MHIFITNGQGASGKDTFVNYVNEILTPLNYSVAKTSIIDYIKQIAGIVGWNGGKSEKDRKFLCNLKNAFDEWDDSPFKVSCCMLKQMQRDDVFCAFIDMREPDDIEKMKRAFPSAQTILIKRPYQLKYGNEADDNVFNYNYDIIIENNGTLEDLKESAKAFCINELKVNVE